MEKNGHRRDRDCEALIEQAKEQIKQVEARVEKARTRAELAESRTELAETRTELAEARVALAEARAQKAESALQTMIQGVPVQTTISTLAEKTRPLEQLSGRQREILRLIAEGQNTKQIAEMLNLSPKTVEYHRAKLMRAVQVYDIPGLVRLAVRAGLVPGER